VSRPTARARGRHAPWRLLYERAVRRQIARVKTTLRSRTDALLVGLVATGLCGCGSAGAVRAPTGNERAQIERDVTAIWRGRSQPEGPGATHPRLRPVVDRIVFSRRHPRFASALVELRGRNGERHGAPAVVLLDLGNKVADVGTTFANACTHGTPRGLRDLLCPDPWRVLGSKRPRVALQREYVQPIRTSNLHALDWSAISLPGGVCGSSRPIRLHRWKTFIHPDVDLLWLNPVVVDASWAPPTFGDLDGDGRDEAALDVLCADGSGLEIGMLSTSSVVLRAVGRSLRVVGVLGSGLPFRLFNRAPRNGVAAIRRGRVIVTTSWFGRYDGTCCPSGRARTVWRYERGRLRPGRTQIVEPPWSSPLSVAGIGAGAQAVPIGRNDFSLVRLLVRGRLRVAVGVYNDGKATRRDVSVTLTVAQPGLRIVRTRTIARIATYSTTVFSGLERVKLGVKATVTVDIDDRGTHPVSYPAVFVRR
jgi:hypothetical protein